MKYTLAALLFAVLWTSACTPGEPSEDSTGKPPPPATQIFLFDAAEAPLFLDANLERANALTAEFAVVGGALIPAQTGGAFPASAGADANLLDGIGFGTYPNPDVQVSAWNEAGVFQSVLRANVILSQSGDSVKFCRTLATTCVTATMTADGQGFVQLALAANVPDTEIGEISPGLSAAVRGTGENGLTITVADPTVLVAPFTPTAGTPFELTWTVARGGIEGSLEYSVAVDGTELASGNTAGDLAAAIDQEGGVALIFDVPVGDRIEYEVDYSYEFGNDKGSFSDNHGGGVNLSPQKGLAFAPLYVYPTLDPDYELLTFSGELGATHAIQFNDGVVGAIRELPGESRQAKVYSTRFNGDDFANTPNGEGAGVDQGIEGGGFYPSPALCYSQAFPTVQGSVAAAVRTEVHRKMYAAVANGVAQADPGLVTLAGALGQTYTALTPPADYITIGTDYADSNVDANITTSVRDTYTVTLNQAVAQTFRDQLNTIITAWENSGAPPAADDPQYLALKQLQFGLNAPNGSKDGVLNAQGLPNEDDLPFGIGTCNGYDCNVAVVIRDVVNGTNFTGLNPTQGVPALASACLWGVRAGDPIPARDATLTGNPDTDAPAYAEIPASPAVVPVREQAAGSLNTLIQGVYINFIKQAFGTAAPASNFSLSMEVGDTASGTAPAVSRIEISVQ
ncbi:hypothetical protein [Haliangium sp.]|uniref:hypothetical protein n=1 Tax=Haliangium sp. TaxID=2663208 RepID=UPI003D0D5C92